MPITSDRPLRSASSKYRVILTVEYANWAGSTQVWARAWTESSRNRISAQQACVRIPTVAPFPDHKGMAESRKRQERFATYPDNFSELSRQKFQLALERIDQF